jgi:hypothetical protein
MAHRFFLAGIIQGSHRGLEVFDQGYRRRIKDLLSGAFPGCELVCPVEDHPDSVRYGDDLARRTFIENVRKAQQCDAVIVYLPEASMGSGIEMWEARRSGVPIFTVTPLASNWVVRILSSRVFADLDDFGRFAASGAMEDEIRRAVHDSYGEFIS